MSHSMRQFLVCSTFSGLAILVCVPLAWSASSSSSSAQQIHPSGDLPFGRLFTTPERRKELDDARSKGGLTHPQITGIDESAAATQDEVNHSDTQPVKLSGVLLRADGQRQIWINGEKDGRNNTAYNPKVQGVISQSATVKVPFHGANSDAILKPGQVWIPSKGRVEETYQLPVSKPAEQVKVAAEENQLRSLSASSTSTQTSSFSTLGVHSSAQSSAK